MSLEIPRNQALVYFDEGVSYQSADALVAQLESLLAGDIVVKKVDSLYLSTESWEDKTIVLAMGGGVCTQWEENLGEIGMKKIREYVRNGKFIGLCAGAYFASAKSFFQLTGQKPNEKQRSVSLFAGRAVGPILATENHLAPEAAKALEVSFRIADLFESGYMYYQGGCLFEVAPEDDKTTVLAHYSQKPVAIHTKVGDGDAFLCGLHPEFVWSDKLAQIPILKSLARLLLPHEKFRNQVWDEIGKRLLLPLK